MFWSKVECDGCNQKVRASRTIYHRGSRFCSVACRDTWTQANPPLVAKGEPAKLKVDLTNTIDAAIAEYRVFIGQSGDPLGKAIGRMVPVVGKINANHDAQERMDARMRFIQYTCECMPLLNGLGYREEAAYVESVDFGGSYRGSELVGILQRARERAANRA